MSFWVYQNWRAGGRKAIIHRDDCGHCNGGNGLSGGSYNRANGKWDGPFETIDAARGFSNGLKNVVYRKEHSCV